MNVFCYNYAIDLVKLTTRSPCTGVGLVVFRSSLGLWLWLVLVLRSIDRRLLGIRCSRFGFGFGFGFVKIKSNY